MLLMTTTAQTDWLIDPTPYRSKIAVTRDTITLTNGLVSRTFYNGANFATVSLQDLTSGEEFVRATTPEATVTIDGKEVPVGGLDGQPDLAYLKPEWLPDLKSPDGALKFVTFHAGKTVARFAYDNHARRAEDHPWPPEGARLTLTFANDALSVDVIYEIYNGLPLISKRIVTTNKSGKPVTLDQFTIEQIAFPETESSVDEKHNWRRPDWTVFTDFSFGGMSPNDDNNNVEYLTDKNYTTQVNYNLQTPVVMRVRPKYGPGVPIEPGKSVSSFTSFLLLHDSTDRERNSLALRKAMRTLAPWTTESPIMLHLTSTDPATVQEAIDQAADCGFEMVILSFGSGLNMEDVSPENIAKYKGFADYAHSKGVQIGGYSLLASRHIDDANDAINPETGKPGGMRFGYSPCLLSQWGIDYFDHIKTFISETGFDLLEHDGSYPGDRCASTTHPGHKGLADSQWRQFWEIADFYHWCRATGVYLNVPDTYFLQGSNKTGMGYRETNWSLPRAQQHIHARQNLYDGTWDKPPTMGWMFVPLVQYHGGGAAATIEPLKDHLADYKQHLYNNLGYGAQACYRGPRLYDSPETEKVVKDAVSWFKKYRDILESDVIHVRRPDGRRLDAILHVNPTLETKGMLMVYNPTDEELSDTIRVPLYYTGLTDKARFYRSDKDETDFDLGMDSTVEVDVTVEPRSFAWFTVK